MVSSDIEWYFYHLSFQVIVQQYIGVNHCQEYFYSKLRELWSLNLQKSRIILFLSLAVAKCNILSNNLNGLGVSKSTDSPSMSF